MDDHATLLPSAPARRRWFIAGLLILFLALSVQYTHKILRRGEGSSAFNRWRPQVLAMAAGEDAYQRFSYPNPPMMAVILLPYYQLPELAGALAWYYTKVALALIALVWTFRLVEDPDRPFPDWAKALTALLSLKPIMGDLTHGNVNLVILFLCVAALYAFQRGRDGLAGVTLGLAIVCKVTPGLFIPYFLWKRAWKTLAGCIAGLVLFYGLVPGLVFGQARNLELLGSWSNVMIKPFMSGEIAYSEYFNQSLPGLFARLLTDSPSDTEWIDNRIQVAVSHHNFATLSRGEFKGLLLGCMAIFGVLVMAVCRTPTTQRRGWRFAAEAGIILLGMLLFSERTWKHHCVSLCVPLAVIAYRLAWAEDRRSRRLLATALGLTLLLMGSTSTLGINETWDSFARLSQVYGAYVGAFFVLVVTLAVSLWVNRSVPDQDDDDSDAVHVSRTAPPTLLRDNLPTLRAFKG